MQHNTVQCTACGRHVPVKNGQEGGPTACPKCGEPFEQTEGAGELEALYELCPSCGELVPADASFCHSCGHELSSEEHLAWQSVNPPAFASLGLALFAWPVTGICFFFVLGQLIQSLLAGIVMGIGAVGFGIWAIVICFRHRKSAGKLTLSLTGIILGAFAATVFGFYALLAQQAAEAFPQTDGALQQMLGTAKRTGIPMKCTACGHEFERSPVDVLFNGTGGAMQALAGTKDINEVLDEYEKKGTGRARCPECGEQAASPALECPNCHAQFVPDGYASGDTAGLDMVCPECGERVPLAPGSLLPGMGKFPGQQ